MMEGQPASPASVSSSAHRGEVTFRVHMVQTLVALGHHGSAICLTGVEGEEMHLASDSWRRIWGATLKPCNPGELVWWWLPALGSPGSGCFSVDQETPLLPRFVLFPGSPSLGPAHQCIEKSP